MTEVQIVHPKIIERQKNPTKFIRDDAARIIIEELQKLKKKIPKKGLNNMTKPQYLDGFGFHIAKDGSLWTIPSEPTLPRRMSKLSWAYPYLPPQMFAIGMTSEEFDKDLAKSLMAECLDLLSTLLINLDSVTVVEKREVENYKKIVWNKKAYLLRPAMALGLVQIAEICEDSDKEDSQ